MPNHFHADLGGAHPGYIRCRSSDTTTPPPTTLTKNKSRAEEEEESAAMGEVRTSSFLPSPASAKASSCAAKAES